MRFGAPYHPSAPKDTMIGFSVDFVLLIALAVLFWKPWAKRKKYTKAEKILMAALLTYFVILNYDILAISTSSMLFSHYAYRIQIGPYGSACRFWFCCHGLTKAIAGAM